MKSIFLLIRHSSVPNTNTKLICYYRLGLSWQTSLIEFTKKAYEPTQLPRKSGRSSDRTIVKFDAFIRCRLLLICSSCLFFSFWLLYLAPVLFSCRPQSLQPIRRFHIPRSRANPPRSGQPI